MLSLRLPLLATVVGLLTSIAGSTARPTSFEKRLLFPATNTATGFPSPLQDPWYKAPANISSYTLGQEVKRRATNSTFSDAASSYQIMFRSNDTGNNAIGGIATVVLPHKPAADTSLLSFQNFEDSVSLTCSPSWAYVAGTNGPAQLAANLEAPIVVNWALQQGYYVVIPDHEGPDSSFIAGFTAGKIILDGMRAALSSQNLNKQTKIGMYGYSGGAHATAWASALHEEYASELNIIGATQGGTPVDPEHILRFLNKGFFSGFALAGVVGTGSAYPELDQYIRSNLNADGVNKFKTITAADSCIGNVVAGYALLDLFSLFNIKNPLDQPIPQKYLRQLTLLQSKSTLNVPAARFPRLIYHALFDEVIPYNDTQAYIEEQCSKAGSGDITAVTVPIAEHITGEVFGIPVAIDYLGKAFKGTLSKVQCGSIIPAIDPSSQQAADILGTDAANKLRQSKATGAWQTAVGLAHASDNNAVGLAR